MNKTLKEKIKYTKELFILSTNDMSNWEQKYSYEYRSKEFNNYRFTIRTDKGGVFLTNYDDMLISAYRLEIWSLKFKMWRTVRKVRNHFKQLERDKKVQKEINFFNDGIKDIEPNFAKQIRKTKLKELEK